MARKVETDGKVVCDCLDQMNKKLVEYNTEIVATLFTGKVALYVEKADMKVRKRAVKVIASFCPFCGEKYPEESK